MDREEIARERRDYDMRIYERVREVLSRDLDRKVYEMLYTKEQRALIEMVHRQMR